MRPVGLLVLALWVILALLLVHAVLGSKWIYPFLHRGLKYLTNSKVDGVEIQLITAMNPWDASLLMELVLTIQLLQQIPELEEQARMGSAVPDLGLVHRMSVVHLRDFGTSFYQF